MGFTLLGVRFQMMACRRVGGGVFGLWSPCKGLWAELCISNDSTAATCVERQLENETDDYKRGHFTSRVKSGNRFFRFVQYSHWFWISFDMGGYLKAFTKCIYISKLYNQNLRKLVCFRCVKSSVSYEYFSSKNKMKRTKLAVKVCVYIWRRLFHCQTWTQKYYQKEQYDLRGSGVASEQINHVQHATVMTFKALQWNSVRGQDGGEVPRWDGFRGNRWIKGSETSGAEGQMALKQRLRPPPWGEKNSYI